MKNQWTEIVCILDRSGSMKPLVTDTIGGFNTFVDKQRDEEGLARISLALFDDRIESPWKHIDIQNAPKLTEEVYFARGSTALLDALGRTVEATRARIEASHPDERPENVIVLVMTDGYENSSREYDLRTVRAMIEKRQGEGWEFVFIGADVNAIDVARTMGMAAGSASRVARSQTGTAEAFSKLNRRVSSHRRNEEKVDVNAPLADDEWL